VALRGDDFRHPVAGRAAEVEGSNHDEGDKNLPLRLSRSLKQAVERLSTQEGTSIN
jgi:hypothetical protein